MGWVLRSETFFLVAGLCYLVMVCVEATLNPDMVEGPVCEELKGSEQCSAACTTSGASTTFVVAFLAGGLMNLERIYGIPVP